MMPKITSGCRVTATKRRIATSSLAALALRGTSRFIGAMTASPPESRLTIIRITDTRLTLQPLTLNSYHPPANQFSIKIKIAF